MSHPGRLWILLGLLVLALGCRPQRPPGDDDDDSADDDVVGDDDDSVDPDAPNVAISAPADGATLNTPDSVSLAGSADDQQDGAITGDGLVWSSDVDGELGTGGNLTVALSVGAHTLTLAAEDSDGNEGSDSVSVTVTDVNEAPEVRIDSPANGAGFVEGSTIAFEGQGQDLEDGELVGGSLFWTSSLDGSFGNGRNASLTDPSLGTHTIVLTGVDSQGQQGIASISVQVAAVGENLPPTATILAPANSSAFLLGDTVDLDGEGDDPEDGALSGSDLQWTSSLDGGLGSGESQSVSGLTQGVHTLTLTATDSEGASATDSISVVVNQPGNDAPTVAIVTPGDGSTVVGATDVLFTGTGTDPEDGALGDGDLAWTSSLDGTLGAGGSLTYGGLSVGSHTITLTATDSGGAVGVDSIALTVLPVNTAPSVAITSPSTGSTYTQGDVISFAGTASDAEDGPLSGSSVVWRSYLFGTMGNGTSLSFGSLGAGTHQITLSAFDSGGLSGSDTISITVDPAAVNLPPVASLTGSNLVNVGDPVTFDGSGSSDPDGTIDDYTFDFGDGSPVQTGSSDAGTHTYSAEGTFTVTLTVTDDEGATGSASLTVEAIIPEPVPEVVYDTDESFGTMCQLVLHNDLPRVIFRNDTHPALHYAEFDGANWSVELVDGMGFDVGGQVGWEMDLALDAAGDPHIVYRFDDGVVRYATRSGASWVREQVNSLYEPPGGYWQVGIDLDPINGERPTVVYSDSTGAYQANDPVVAYRTGAGTWVEENYPQSSYSYAQSAGGIRFTASGVAWLTFDPDEGRIMNWSAAQGFFGEDVVPGSFGSSTYMPVVLDSSNQPIILTDEAVFHRVGGVWIRSDYEQFDADHFDLGINAAGDEYLVHRHGTGIELIHGEPYWVYEYQGPMDPAQPGIDVDATGKPWACFFRSGNLMVY